VPRNFNSDEIDRRLIQLRMDVDLLKGKQSNKTTVVNKTDSITNNIIQKVTSSTPYSSLIFIFPTLSLNAETNHIQTPSFFTIFGGRINVIVPPTTSNMEIDIQHSNDNQVWATILNANMVLPPGNFFYPVDLFTNFKYGSLPVGQFIRAVCPGGDFTATGVTVQIAGIFS
jgi:hypothetical protein